MPHKQRQDFSIRPATLEDADDIATLMNACALDRGEQARSAAQHIRALMNMPGLNLETDTCLAVDSSGTVIGCGLVQDSPASNLLSALAEVHPDLRGEGVGMALCRWIEGRAGQAVHRIPIGSRLAVVQKRLSMDEASHQLLLREGYQVVRHNFRMVIEMTQAPIQPTPLEGFEIRPFVPVEESKALVRAIQEAFRDNWGYVERPFEVEYQRWMHLLEQEKDLGTGRYWFVAVHEREIAGFALSRMQVSQDPEEAAIEIVGVRPDWRRRGIAFVLLQHSFLALYQAGKRRVELEVEAENPTGATRLYEKAGMVVDRRYDFLEKELRSGTA